MKPRPYIAVTDVPSGAAASQLYDTFLRHRPHKSPYRFHVGVMTSDLVINGTPYGYPGTFPDPKLLPEIFSLNGADMMNCIHYASKDRQPKEFSESIVKTIEACGPNLHAIQFDMPWPSYAEIQHALKTANRELEIVIQVGRVCFEEAKDKHDIILKHLYGYKHVGAKGVHVLLDKSLGTAKPMDTEFLIPFIDAIKNEYPEYGIGIAGGLGPDSTYLAEPILRNNFGISSDAQGGLHENKSYRDPFDMQKADEYVLQMAHLLSLSPVQ